MDRDWPSFTAAAVRANVHRRRRVCNVAFRTLHLIAFALLLGGHAYDVAPARLVPALLATLVTGALLVVVEIHGDLRWPFLGKGLFVQAKLALLLLVPVFPGARLPLLLTVVVLAALDSHMPRRYRHYSVLERRVVACEKTDRVVNVRNPELEVSACPD